MSKEQGVTGSIKAALKADTVVIIAFEAGMFSWMTIVHCVLFDPPKRNEANYWFEMQIAMIVEFLTSYPVNWALRR